MNKTLEQGRGLLIFKLQCSLRDRQVNIIKKKEISLALWNYGRHSTREVTKLSTTP